MTIQNTPVYALPYPQSGDPADAPTQLQALCARIEAVLQPIETQGKSKDTTLGTLSARPAPSATLAGRHFYATDVVADYVDTGSTWLRTTVPAGAIMAILAAAAPTGWLLCDGSAIANSGAAVELYAAIGATRPDLRGRVPVGVDGAAARMAANDALTNGGGAERVALDQTMIPAHVHPIQNMYGKAGDPTHNHGGAGFATAPGPGDPQPNGATASTGSGATHDNMPPYQVVNWIVKL